MKDKDLFLNILDNLRDAEKINNEREIRSLMNTHQSLTSALGKSDFMKSYLLRAHPVRDYFLRYQLLCMVVVLEEMPPKIKTTEYCQEINVIFSFLKERVRKIIANASLCPGDPRFDPLLIAERCLVLQKKIKFLPANRYLL